MVHCGAGTAAHAVRTHTCLLSLREWAWQRQHGGGAEPARPALGRPWQGHRMRRSDTLLSCGAHDHDHDHAGCNGHAHAHVDPDDVRLNVSASEAQGQPARRRAPVQPGRGAAHC